VADIAAPMRLRPARKWIADISSTIGSGRRQLPEMRIAFSRLAIPQALFGTERQRQRTVVIIPE
jgi:hypothetical protein